MDFLVFCLFGFYIKWEIGLILVVVFWDNLIEKICGEFVE